MPSFRSLEKELALIDFDYASPENPNFHGKKDEFTNWISKVEHVFNCCNLDNKEKFKVVISRLRGRALQWWQNYKITRRKKGKEKVRSWKKMKTKLMGAFCHLFVFSIMFLCFLKRKTHSPYVWTSFLTRGAHFQPLSPRF